MMMILAALVLPGFGQKEIEKTAKAKDAAMNATAPDSLKKWYINGNGTLNFSQASFTNWASGGDNSIGLDAFLNLKANYKKGRHAWANTLDLGYGFQFLGVGDDASFRKTNDKIELTTAYGYELSKKWFLTGLVNFRTQFAQGYNYPNDSVYISKFMAPGYLIAGVGVTSSPYKWFYMYLSPASARMTFVLDDSLSALGQFGVTPGEQLRTEFGAYFRMDMNADLAKNISLATTLELYTDYLKNFGAIDVNWNVMLSMKVNKWLAASLTTQLIYDEDVMITTKDGHVGPRVQFKEILGVGLTYMIKNSK